MSHTMNAEEAEKLRRIEEHKSKAEVCPRHFARGAPKIKRERVRPDRPDRQPPRSAQASIADLCPAAGQQAACSCATPPIIPSCPVKEALSSLSWIRSRTPAHEHAHAHADVCR